MWERWTNKARKRSLVVNFRDVRLNTFVVTESSLRGDWWLYDQCLGWHFTTALMWNVRGLMYWPKYVTYSVIKLEKRQINLHLFLFHLHFISLHYCNETRKSIKGQNVGLRFGTHVRIWLSATLVALCGSSAAHCQYCSGRKPLFYLFSRGTYTHCFFKRPLFVRITFWLPVFCVITSYY